MSRSSFSKAYEEIANFKPTEMTFTIEDADLDKLNDVLKDINVREYPWFDVQDKYGNKARYYREEPHWIPCTPETMPKESGSYLVSGKWASGKVAVGDCEYNKDDGYFRVSWNFDVLAWMPLPKPYWREGEKE